MKKPHFNYGKIVEPTLTWLSIVYDTFSNEQQEFIPDSLRTKLYDLELPKNYYRFLNTSGIIKNIGNRRNPTWINNLGIRPTIYTAEKFISDFKLSEYKRLHGNDAIPHEKQNHVKSQNITTISKPGKFDLRLIEQINIRTFETIHPEDDTIRIKFEVDMIEKNINICGVDQLNKIQQPDLTRSIKIIDLLSPALKKINDEFKSFTVKSKLFE